MTATKKKISTTEFVKLMVDKELEIAGALIRYDDLIANKDDFPHWYQDWCFDRVEQYLEWKQFYYDHFYDHYPKRVKDISNYFSWFALQYGLRYNFDYKELEKYEHRNR